MTLCKQTPPAGAASGHALSSSGLFPACPGERNGLGSSESQRHRRLGNTGLTDGKGQEISSLLGVRRPQHSSPTFFQFLKMAGALWESTPFPTCPPSPLFLCSSTGSFSFEFPPSLAHLRHPASTQNISCGRLAVSKTLDTQSCPLEKPRHPDQSSQ